MIRFAEFSPLPPTEGTFVSALQDAWVELYDDQSFTGRVLRIVGDRAATIPDYGQLRVQGDVGFNDNVAAARYQIPPGEVYRLYEDRDWSGEYVDLIGTGGEEQLVLERPLSENVSSSLFARVAVDSPIVRQAHTEGINQMAVSPYGTYIVTASDDGTARVWDPYDGTQVAVLQHGAPVTAAAFEPEETWLTTGDEQGTIRTWSPQSGELRDSARASSAIRHLAVESEKLAYVALASDSIMLLSFSELSPIGAHRGNVNHLALDVGRGYLASSSDDDRTIVWNTGTLSAYLEFEHGSDVNYAAFHPFEPLMVTASDDDVGYLWDLETGERLIEMIVHLSDVDMAAFSPTGQHIASVGAGGQAFLSQEYGAQLRGLDGHRSAVNCLAFDPNGELLVTGGADGTAKIWDVNNGELIQSLDHSGQSVDYVGFARDGQVLVTASGDGRVRLWRMYRDLPEARPLEQ
jgi:WD40 repeat protein